MSQRRPTMLDVARRTGVSLKTVSRVINGERGVAEATAREVRRAVTSLGFRPNDLARGLRAGQTSATIGLVIEDVSNPFYATIARAVESVASPRHFMVVIGSSEEDNERERQLIASLCSRRVDGLLIVPASGSHRYLEDELSRGTPMVFLDRPPAGLKADTIVIDNRRGAEAAVAHLIGLGHRRIAMVSDRPTIYTAGERLIGYRRALLAAGMTVDEELIVLGPHDPAAAEAAVTSLLKLRRPPTAFFASNNRMTVGIVRALRAGGSRAAVVGFDDFELSELIPMPLVVVSHDPRAMGMQAAQLLLDRIEGRYSGPPRRVTLPTELIARGTGPLAPRDRSSRSLAPAFDRE